MIDRFSLRPLLWNHVSQGALDYSRHPWFIEYRLEADYGCEAIEPAGRPTGALSFLAWIKAWLCLIVGMGAASDLPPTPKANDAPLNRRFARRRRNKDFAARKLDELVWHIYRRYGLKRCQQWLYNRGPTGRVRWCFGIASQRWRREAGLAKQPGESFFGSPCNAPLSPD